MGALQARLVFLAFVGLSAVIAYNAMYLQDGPHTGRFSADLNNLDRNIKVDRTATGSAPRPVGDAVRPDTVKAIQRQLSARGYEPGPADGVHGLFTRAAVMAYQHDNKMQVTGAAGEVLLKQMIFDAGGAGKKPKRVSEIPEETVVLVKAVQEVLAKMGYDPGPVDGLLGPGTARAIKSFEEQQKMPVKGRISGKFLKALIDVTGAKLASFQAR